MKFNLNPLKKYKKRHANLYNSYKSFLPRKDKVLIDLSLFDAKMSPGVYFADSGKDYRRSQKTKIPFIYFRKKGFLLFNQNGEEVKLGKGGIAALFPKNLKLRINSFKFVNNNYSDYEPTPTAEPTPTTNGFFAYGPRPIEMSTQEFSGDISLAGEVDRISINSSVGDVVSLSVSASDGTYPLVRLVDSDGNILSRSVAYDSDSASTSSYRSQGELLFAEVYAQLSFKGNYSLQSDLYATDSPSLSFPQDLLIILDQGSMQSADLYASRYLFSDNGLIYISFGSGLTSVMMSWWEDVLAATDALIEPEFVVVPEGHEKSQMVINQVSSSSLSGDAAGIYQTPSFTWSELVDGSDYNFRRVDQQGKITLAESAFSHASRFADSREAGWKSTAFHELGHALGLEHPHEGSDGDVDYVIDTNGTVMSYKNEQDADGDPGFTDLDRKALQFVYGSESGVSTASPLAGIPLLIDSREFDLSQRWKAPQLTAEWVGGNSVLEPRSGLETKTLQVSRSDGDIAVASTVWLDFDTGPDVMNWTSRNGYSEGFHDVLILGNSVTFQPGEAIALFELPIVAGSHAESDEWLDVTVRPQYPDLYSNVLNSSLRLTIVDA